MDANERKALLHHRMIFVKDLEPSDILSYLFQERLLSENDVDRIRSLKTRRERVELLLDTIPRKGKMAYITFVKALSKTEGYQHLARILFNDEEKQGDVVDAGADKEKRAPKDIQPPETDQSKPSVGSIPSYPMDTIPRGWCLIINNTRFVGSGLPDRLGADVDGNNMYKLFQKLQFKVHYLKDIDGERMQSAVRELSTYDHSNMSCVAVVIMSHGKQGTVLSYDSVPLKISSLIQPLISQSGNKLLKGKPKLFFIQACRVTDADLEETSDNTQPNVSSVEILSDPVENLKKLERTPDKTEVLLRDISEPIEADMVLAYSTFPASVSLRNIEKGSWFIQSIVEVFDKYSNEEDVLSMLLRVNDMVASRISTDGATQIPAPVISLRKKLFLTT